jgi:hypothetical protein
MNQPPPYQPPGMPPKTEGLAIAALVLGLVGIVFCFGALSGIPAIICGHIGRSRIRSANGALEGGGLAMAGLIMGYIATVLTAIAIAALAIGFSKAWPAFKQSATGVLPPTAEISVIMEAERIEMALEAYRTEYGTLPPLTPIDGEEVDAAVFIAILQGKNERNIRFYQPAANASIDGVPLDPWKRPLHIAIDTDGSGRVKVSTSEIEETVAVWSDGANQKNEMGQGDDATSW